MFQHETTAGQYAIDTLDPVASTMHIRDTNYHYYLTLQRKYSPTCCPLYLTREGYDTLRSGNGKVVDSIRIHTDSIINVLRRLEPQSLTVFVAMDQYAILSYSSVLELSLRSTAWTGSHQRKARAHRRRQKVLHNLAS